MYLGSSIYYGDEEMRELIILQKYGVLFNYVYCGIRVCVCVCWGGGGRNRCTFEDEECTRTQLLAIFKSSLYE